MGYIGDQTIFQATSSVALCLVDLKTVSHQTETHCFVWEAWEASSEKPPLSLP